MDNSKILMIYVIIVSLSNIIFKGNIRSGLNRLYLAIAIILGVIFVVRKFK